MARIYFGLCSPDALIVQMLHPTSLQSTRECASYNQALTFCFRIILDRACAKLTLRAVHRGLACKHKTPASIRLQLQSSAYAGSSLGTHCHRMKSILQYMLLAYKGIRTYCKIAAKSERPPILSDHSRVRLSPAACKKEQQAQTIVQIKSSECSPRHNLSNSDNSYLQ